MLSKFFLWQNQEKKEFQNSNVGGKQKICVGHGFEISSTLEEQDVEGHHFTCDCHWFDICSSLLLYTSGWAKPVVERSR